jgi:hypothetical protein
MIFGDMGKEKVSLNETIGNAHNKIRLLIPQSDITIASADQFSQLFKDTENTIDPATGTDEKSEPTTIIQTLDASIGILIRLLPKYGTPSEQNPRIRVLREAQGVIKVSKEPLLPVEIKDPTGSKRWIALLKSTDLPTNIDPIKQQLYFPTTTWCSSNTDAIMTISSALSQLRARRL